jgi:hypothetical protein
MFAGVQSLAMLLHGDASATRAWLDWMIEVSRDIGEPRAALGIAARVHASLGHREQAVDLLTEMMLQPGNSGAELPSLTRTLVALEQLDLAEQLVAAEATSVPMSRHARVAAQAVLAEARGDHQVALDRYRDAAKRWHDFTMYVEEAFALLGQGRCLIALDCAPEAIPVLELARDRFAEMGARPALAETEALFSAIRPR